MSMDSWMTAKKGAFESAEVFAQPPHKSRQFIVVTVVVALSIFLACGMLIGLSHRVSLLTMTWISLLAITVLGNWIRALIVHRRLHELYVSAGAKEGLAGVPLDTALRASSTLIYWGTSAAAATGIAGLGAVIQLIVRPR